KIRILVGAAGRHLEQGDAKRTHIHSHSIHRIYQLAVRMPTLREEFPAYEHKACTVRGPPLRVDLLGDAHDALASGCDGRRYRAPRPPSPPSRFRQRRVEVTVPAHRTDRAARAARLADLPPMADQQ